MFCIYSLETSRSSSHTLFFDLRNSYVKLVETSSGLKWVSHKKNKDGSKLYKKQPTLAYRNKFICWGYCYQFSSYRLCWCYGQLQPVGELGIGIIRNINAQDWWLIDQQFNHGTLVSVLQTKLVSNYSTQMSFCKWKLLQLTTSFLAVVCRGGGCQLSLVPQPSFRFSWA